MTESALVQRLDRLQLVVVTGKGGVGKSALCATLGRWLVSRGRRVLLMEIDPRENLHHLLDVAPSGGEIVRVRSRLYLQHLSLRQVLDDLVQEKLRLDLLARRVLDSPVYQHFAEGAPGLKETGVFGRIVRLLRGHGPRNLPPPDVVLLDAPASGHGVSLMTAPQLVADVITSGPVGHMAAEIATFVGDQKKCGVIVVTLAEEMPVQEAIELIGILEAKQLPRPDLAVVNALYPALETQPASAEGDQLWYRRRQVNEKELARLRSLWSGPLVELPLLAIDPGPALVAALGRHLDRALGEL